MTNRDFSLGPEFDGAGAPYFALRIAATLAVLRSGVQTHVAVEFGVGSGTSTRILAEHMPVIGFDSGEGLPEDWRPEFPKGSFRYDIPEVPGAMIVPGWFADALPSFDFENSYPIALVHFDADLYSSTATALKYVGPHLRPGCIVVFDEWFGYDGAEDGEQRAWREFADRTGVDWDVVGHGDQAWIIRIIGGQA